MTGHGKKQKNFAACLGCTEYALVLGTNLMLCAFNKLWQVQWAFLPWQGLERCTSATNNSEVWDDVSALTLIAEKTRYGLACMSRCMSVLCSGWVQREYRDTVLCNQYVSCLPLLPTWELPLKQHSSTNSLSYKPIKCHLLKIHWEAAHEVNEYGKVYLFHCVKASPWAKVMPPWKCINYSSCCTNQVFSK